MTEEDETELAKRRAYDARIEKLGQYGAYRAALSQIGLPHARRPSSWVTRT